MTKNRGFIQFNLDQSQAREIMSLALARKSKVRIINQKNDTYFILPLGQLQKIQSFHPHKVPVHLEEPDLIFWNSKIINRNNEQYINYQDLWFETDFYDLFLAQTRTNMLGIEPDDPHYAPELDIANIVFTAARNDKKCTLPMKKKVKQCLDKMYPDLSSEAKKRIIMITNTVSGKKPGRKKQTQNN